MPKLTSIVLYPYSGWYDRPWVSPGVTPSAIQTDALDLDAAARSARRVTEQLSVLLGAQAIESRRGGYQLYLRDVVESATFPVTPDVQFARDGFVYGLHSLPRGFRLLLPDQRAHALTEAVRENLRPIAEREGWMDRLDGAVQALHADRYRCEWTGPWKSTRDRRLMVRISAAILDDGYGRWTLQIADPDGRIVRETTPMVGWTWLQNFHKMSKTMRFRGPRVLEVGTGSGILTMITSIDLDTAAVIQLGADKDIDPQVTTYPGEPGHPTPDVEVLEYVPLKTRVVREGGIARLVVVDEKLPDLDSNQEPID